MAFVSDIAVSVLKRDVKLQPMKQRPRLASLYPIWSDMTSVDTITQWREDWSSASAVNHTVVTVK